MQPIIRSIRIVLHPIRTYKSIVQEIHDSDFLKEQTRQLLKKQFQGSNDPKDDYVLFSMLVKIQELKDNRRKTYIPVFGPLINGFIIVLGAYFVYNRSKGPSE